jgi:hypothetical protein
VDGVARFASLEEEVATLEAPVGYTEAIARFGPSQATVMPDAGFPVTSQLSR